MQKAPKGGWVLATAEIPARTLWRGNLLNLKTENCIEQDIGSGKITISTHSSSSGINLLPFIGVEIIFAISAKSSAVGIAIV